VHRFRPKPRAISTAQLNASRHLHLRPIYVLFSNCPYLFLKSGKPILRARFPLRCFQRLSVICGGYSANATCMTADSPVTYSLRSSRTRSNSLQASYARSR